MITNFILKNNQPKYRIKQFNQAFYQELISSFDQITAWSKDLRYKLKRELPFITLKNSKQFISQDKNTIKILFKVTRLGKMIETVLMKHNDGRNTLCVSCMVGCPVGCKFCATGKLGFSGNLSYREIIDQVMYFQRELALENKKLTNIVFMGMGEPMLNLDNVWRSIQIMIDPEKLNMGSRRITISTSGYVPQLQDLIDRGFRGKIAISLHAVDQKLREELMPVAKQYDLHSLFKVLDNYVNKTNKRVSYEYILISGVTDRVNQAKKLVQLFRKRLSHINLIPYNPVRGENFKRPIKKDIFRFAQILKQGNISHTLRVTMGDDIKAACGQLAGK